MKICHVTSVHPRYDIRIFEKECRTLSAYFDICLVVADSLGNECKDNVAIYDVGKLGGGRLNRILKTSKAIYNKIIELKPTVVHLHDPELLVIATKLVGLGYKVIYDAHEDVPKQVLNKYWIPKIIRPLISKLIELKEIYIAKKLTGVICATEIIANRFKPYNPNTIAIHNYPILAELTQPNLDWSTRNDSLCYLGSISEARGVLPLIDSLAVSRLKLELAGSFSDESIKYQINASKGYSYVNYHGVLDRNAVINLLNKVKVGVVTLLPTPSYVESLPIKLFEYMLAGIPVITSNFEFWEKYVKDVNCGIMVNPNDHVAIARAAVYLMNHQDEAKQMGERGRQAVLNRYTWEKEGRNLVKYYKNI